MQNDTVGNQYASALSGGTTTTTDTYNGNAFVNGGTIGQVTSGYVQTCWPYTLPATQYTYWPTYYPYPVENAQHNTRIAELEGEVKVLREMVAALVGGGRFKPKAKRPRKV